jgi:hypothetical protein
LSNVVLLSREGTLYFKIECSILGSLYNFIFWGDGPIKLDHCPKQNKSNVKTWEAPHLINRRGDLLRASPPVLSMSLRIIKLNV